MKTTKAYFLIMLLCTITFSACQTSESKDNLILTGEIEGYGDGQILISFSDPVKLIKDTIIVINNKFEYKRTLKAPTMAFMRIMGNENLKKDYHRIDYFVENSDIEFKLDLNDIDNHKITGSKSHEMHRKFAEESLPFMQDIQEASKALRNPEITEQQKVDLETKAEKARKAYFSKMIKFDDFSTSPVMAYTLWLSEKRSPLDEIRKIIPLFEPEFIENNMYLQFLASKIEGEDSIKPGEIAADFSVKDINGKDYSIQDFKGNYTLMMFSASWCVWCKPEYQYLKEAYERYSDKGLQIVIMNLDDEKELWAHDVDKYNFPFPVLSNLEAFNGNLTENYSVNAIPRIFLIDPNGIIVANGLRGERIFQALDTVYNLSTKEVLISFK